tara:strand:+ start:1204 stop:1569 length:366 start_codon:yes stop_codon:yes gene_type:complete
MAYNKRNNSERLPKQEYFQLRLKDAVRDGNQDKADYYRSRLAQLENVTFKGNMEYETDTPESETVSLDPIPMFASRDTIQEAIDYADMMSKSSESPIHAIAPVFVLYNTIAEQYDLVPKAK